MLLLLTALCYTILPEIIVASRCANSSGIGRNSEIIATKFDDVTCGDPLISSYDCPRYIEAKSNNANGYSQVRLAGRYSLLGSVSCNPLTGNNNCTLSTTGDIIVGCCGSYTAYESFIGGDGSTITVGSNSSVNIAKLLLEKSTFFTVGDNTNIYDTSKTTSIVVKGNSHLTLSSPSGFVFDKSTIEIGDFCDFKFDSTGSTRFYKSSWIAKSGSDVDINRSTASFNQVSINSIATHAIIEDVTLEWMNTNLNLDHSSIYWRSTSSVKLDFTNVTMLDSSFWTIFNSTVSFEHISVTFGSDATLYLSNCDLYGGGKEGNIISIGQKSSLTLRGNTTESLVCLLTADLIIPPNVHYTQANLSDWILLCDRTANKNSEAFHRYRKPVLRGYDINEMNNVQTGDQRMGQKSVIHYNNCPIGATTVTTGATSSATTASNKPATTPTIPTKQSSTTTNPNKPSTNPATVTKTTSNPTISVEHTTTSESNTETPTTTTTTIEPPTKTTANSPGKTSTSAGIRYSFTGTFKYLLVTAVSILLMKTH